MITRFRQFMKEHPLSCHLREQDGTPALGSAPPSPVNPDNKTNKHHFDALQQQLGIDDDDLTSALEAEPIQVWKVPDYSAKWGFMVIGPCSAVVKQRPDGNYDVTFQLAEKKLMSPKSFIRPYKQGERPIRFEGEVTDQTETISAEELQDIMATPLMDLGQGMMPPAMGGPAAGGSPMMGSV